jgi:hypothetical protein
MSHSDELATAEKWDQDYLKRTNDIWTELLLVKNSYFTQ